MKTSRPNHQHLTTSLAGVLALTSLLAIACDEAEQLDDDVLRASSEPVPLPVPLPDDGGGSEPMAAEFDGIIDIQKLVQTPTPRSSNFVVAPASNTYSHLDWLFMSTEIGAGTWHITPGSVCHYDDDYYADDWNYGSGDDDLGRTVYASAPGTVIYAGNTGNTPGYGNQVVVELADDSSMAIRYAHLESIAVESGDYVHFGSEVGSVGDTNGQPSPHLHVVLYRSIDTNVGGQTGRARLMNGSTPSGTNPCSTQGPATVFAAWFQNDAIPYSTHPDGEDLPCNMWNGDVQGCDAHSIVFGGQVYQDCAYYLDSDLCLPRGTANCRAHIDGACWDGDPLDDADESLPCHTWDNQLSACDDHSIPWGNGVTRDCAYYSDTGKCRPRGTPNCAAGIEGDCY